MISFLFYGRRELGQLVSITCPVHFAYLSLNIWSPFSFEGMLAEGGKVNCVIIASTDLVTGRTLTLHSKSNRSKQASRIKHEY